MLGSLRGFESDTAECLDLARADMKQAEVPRNGAGLARRYADVVLVFRCTIRCSEYTALRKYPSSQ